MLRSDNIDCGNIVGVLHQQAGHVKRTRPMSPRPLADNALHDHRRGLAPEHIGRGHFRDGAMAHRLPWITFFVGEELSYGLPMSYGQDFPDFFRRAAGYVDKILKGADPADLPVEQPTKFKLVLNLKTAKTLGLSFPQTLITSADEVIE